MTRIVVGALTVAALSVLAALAFWVLWPNEALTAEAAVAQACAAIEAEDSFDIRLVHWGDTPRGRYEMVSNIEFSGNLKRYTHTESMAGVSSGITSVTIVDTVNRTSYMRDRFTNEWKAVQHSGEEKFPHTRDSICPDLTGAAVTFIGEETIDGQQTRKYSYETVTKLFDWYFWIDSNGWLIKVESTKLGARAARTVQSGGAELRASATISGRGEANTITIPSVGQ